MVLFLSLNLRAGTADISWTTRVVDANETGPFRVGIGSAIEVNGQSALFMGKILNHDGSFHSLMVLNPAKTSVQYVPAAYLKKSPQDYQNIMKPYEQQGGTCTGYALDNFLLQTSFSGFAGNGKLGETISSEEGRTSLLADTINQYYLVTQHRYSIVGILNGYGKKFDFSCRKKVFSDLVSAHNFVIESLQAAQPVMISFNIGSNMIDGPFKLKKSDSKKAEDQRLWLPRKIGERNGGGHTVVAVGGFSTEDSTYLVMLDSDWDLPRVWDLNEALSNRTAWDEVEFYTCK